MEIQLVLGPNNSGKSLYAEKLAVESGSKRIYLATMIPQNEENRLRIEKHRLQRKYKGFQTIEAGWNIDQIFVDSDSVILLEDASNLLANGMFEHSATPQQVYNLILDLAKRCCRCITQRRQITIAEHFHEILWNPILRSHCLQASNISFIEQIFRQFIDFLEGIHFPKSLKHPISLFPFSPSRSAARHCTRAVPERS